MRSDILAGMPAYVIHIGPPKTATTYLQRHFTRHAGALAAQGVLYPRDLGTPGHVKLAAILAEAGAEQRLAPVFAALNQSDARCVLLSSENLASLRRPQIEVLRQLLGGHGASIVYYCRRWSDMLRSRWGERVKHGAADTLQAYCAAAMEAPLRSSAINYGLSLKRWAGLFGPQSLRLAAMSTLADSNTELAAHFLENFVAVDTRLETRTEPQNRAMALAETEILRALNAIEWTERHQRGASLRKAFVQRRDLLELDRSRAAIMADLTECVVDETTPRLIKLHRALYAQYHRNLVAPHLDGWFFEPRRAVLAAPSGAWQNDPEIRAELHRAYAALRLHPGRKAA